MNETVWYSHVPAQLFYTCCQHSEELPVSVWSGTSRSPRLYWFSDLIERFAGLKSSQVAALKRYRLRQTKARGVCPEVQEKPDRSYQVSPAMELHGASSTFQAIMPSTGYKVLPSRLPDLGSLGLVYAHRSGCI